jgi:formate C-acetyltransferase
MEILRFESTARVEKLKQELYEQANKDRSSEWFKKEEFENIAKSYPEEPVIIRKAYAIKEMLNKLTEKNIAQRTLTYKINDGELIVGVLPMGSNGLGKVFPNYLTENEQRVGAFSNRTELSLLGHNTVNYEILLSKGLNGIIKEAKEKLAKLMDDGKNQEAYENEKQNSIDFYNAVIISCEAVVRYAISFADLADEMAGKLTGSQEQARKDELLEISRICRKVPMEKPDTFYEALQGIYLFHVALHASMNFLSLGRLDQVLVKYLDQSKVNDVQYIKKCTELFECFIIKAAWRLNLTTEYLLPQDHMDNNAALGVHPYYLDQRAGVNNFLQNIIVGGKTPEGDDATNLMTYIILNAFENVNLSTPGIYVRLHKDSPQQLKEVVSSMLSKTKNLPNILNDDVLIPAFYKGLVENDVEDEVLRMENLSGEKAEYLRLANDYCVDGCWEPILNGISDWTFGMINGMVILQCALNRGATLDTNPGTLRGGKLSFVSETVDSYEKFKQIFTKHMQFFIDQSTLGLYEYYMLDEFVNPSPLFSAVLGTCMEKGRDKSWGGTQYNIGGTILIGVPDVINTVAAIKEWVFEKKKYVLQDVLDAMTNNFQSPSKDNVILQKKYNNIKIDFNSNSSKFGNNDKETNEIGNFIITTYCDAVKSSKKLADRIFLKPLHGLSEKEKREIIRLRKICGYYGNSLQSKFGKDFNIRFTAGLGTFEQYPFQGIGIVASADRNSNDPLAPNFSPYPGTVINSAAHILESLKALDMKRLAAGAITDLCIDCKMNNKEHISGIINKFISSGGSMMSLSIGDKEEYQTIYQLSVTANKAEDKEVSKAAYEKLQKYQHINVRVGGWQAPFISMSLAQQENYVLRILEG